MLCYVMLIFILISILIMTENLHRLINVGQYCFLENDNICCLRVFISLYFNTAEVLLFLDLKVGLQ